MSILEALASQFLADLVRRLVADLSNFATQHKDVDLKLQKLRMALKRIESKANCLNLPSKSCELLDVLTQCSYEAEDIIDSYHVAQMQKKHSGFFKISLAGWKLKPSKIQSLLAMLEEVEKYLPTESCNETNQGQSSVGQAQSLQQTPPGFQFMREEDKKDIIDKLICPSSGSGVAIIGMWGIGKTQLAHAILNDERITNHFRPISYKVNLEPPAESQLPGDKPVLILFDDLSRMDRQYWRVIKSQHLGKPGSKFLVTTRNKYVADVTGSYEYHLPPLPDEDCFELILNSANSNRNLKEEDKILICRNEDKLVGKCYGLPKLADSIGLMLSAASDRRQIVTDICTKSLWQLPQLEDDLQNLNDSLELPSEFRRCFTYYSLFHPSDGFEKENLFYLWLAEAFIEEGNWEKMARKLSKLRSLDVFVVGTDEKRKIAELEHMRDLRKSLCIAKLENVKDNEEAKAAELSNKGKLEKLELQWSTAARNQDAKQILEGLKPPTNLKKLTISKYGGTNFPGWLSETEVCGNLLTVHLEHCEACTVLPSLGQLALLKTLRVVAMYNLESIQDEFFGEGCRTDQSKRFPRLESLELNELPKLTRWTGLRDGYMPRIRNLQIVECKMLVTLPQMDCLTSLKELAINWCQMVEELPAIPSSLEDLTITDNDILKGRCRVGQPDWAKIIGIKVTIDSEIVDTSPPSPEEAIGHQSSSIQTILQEGTELFSSLRVNFRLDFWIIVLALLLLPGFIR